MAYATLGDVLDALDPVFAGQLADDVAATDPGAVVYGNTTGVVAACLEDSDSFCDSYLGARYVVPITVVIPALRRASTSIAVYYLHLRRSWTVTREIKQAYDDAVDWLKDVRSGQGEISTATAPIAPPSGKTSTFAGDTRIFTSDSMKGFM